MNMYDRWDYVQVPLHLLPKLLEDQMGTAMDMLHFGVWYHSKTLENDENEISRVKEAILKLKLPLEMKPEEVLYKANSIGQESKFVETMQPMVKKNHLIDLLREQKKERDLLDFIAYVSIHSMIGDRKQHTVYKDTIIARMQGYNSRYDVPVELSPIEAHIAHSLGSYDKMNRMFKRLEKKYYLKKTDYNKKRRGYRVVKGN